MNKTKSPICLRFFTIIWYGKILFCRTILQCRACCTGGAAHDSKSKAGRIWQNGVHSSSSFFCWTSSALLWLWRLLLSSQRVVVVREGRLSSRALFEWECVGTPFPLFKKNARTHGNGAVKRQRNFCWTEWSSFHCTHAYERYDNILHMHCDDYKTMNHQLFSSRHISLLYSRH